MNASTCAKDNTHFLKSLLSFTQTLWQRVSSLTTRKLTFEMWLLFLLVLDVPSFCNSIGYSYSRFVGPVTGPEKVLVRDSKTGIGNVDYVAHPKYQFSYGIEDGEQRVLQNHKETRDGDNVHGVYSVVDPDGSLRVVKYTADDVNGFQAEVITNGVPVIYGHSNLNVDSTGRGRGYWQTKLPSYAGSEEDSANGNEEEEDEVEDEDDGENDDEENEYEGTSEVGSSEEEFEDAEEVSENNNTV